MPLLWFIIFLEVNSILCVDQWIDPHDMNIGKSSIHQNILATNSPCICPTVTKTECDNSDSSFDVAMSHYKRTINLLLSSAVLDRSDSFNYKGHLHITISSEDYDKLHKFANSDEEDVAALRGIDKVLSKILIKTAFEKFTDTMITWFDQIYFFLFSRTTGLFGVCVSLLVITYKLVRANLTLWTVLKYLVFLGWVIDFTFTWLRLLQEAEINVLVKSMKYSTIPLQCNPNKMSMWQYMQYSFSFTDYCKEYHEVMFKDQFWSFGPLVVVAHQFGMLVLAPANYIGSAVGTFAQNIYNSLPWGVGFFLLPTLLIFSATFMCILLSFLTGTSFKVNIPYMVQFEFGKTERNAVGDAISGRNLSALLNVMNRNMIEEVKQPTNDNIVTSEVFDFREATATECPIKQVESKQICENPKPKTQDLTIDTIPKTHDGSGDKVECVTDD